MKRFTWLVGAIVPGLWILWIPHHVVTADEPAVRVQVTAATSLAATRNVDVENRLPTLSARSERDRIVDGRLASVLQKLGKNLIFDRTRGGVEIYPRASRAVVLVLTHEGIGSGAIINGEGHVITNAHVIGTYPHVVVVFKPKDSSELKTELAFRATVEKVDQVSDLALLKIEASPKSLVFLSLGDMSTLAIGQDVHAIGHPDGEVWTYTKGIISQIRPQYTWSTSDGRSHQATVIQTQTPVNPGNSGGPLLDDRGKLIGINSFRRSGEGLNYAVAVDEIVAFRERASSRPSTPSPTKPRCVETYDTKGQGWINIVGCYSAAPAPPPDLWVVSRAPKERAAYMAIDSLVTGQIDTVVKNQDPQWQTLRYYIDSDCNGTVDLIGSQRKGSTTVDGYRVPVKPMRLLPLAKELDSALKHKKIPYPKLRVCQ